MRSLIRLILTVLGTIPLIHASDREADRTVPPDFPEIDFGVALAGDHLKVRVFNDCTLTGQAVGGLWIGHQISPTEWDADLQVPYNYARSHHGAFFGTYKICGSGGQGGITSPPPPLVWHGSAGAGHIFVGPMIDDFFYIHSFSAAAAFPGVLAAFITANNGALPTPTQVVSLEALLAILAGSANPVPPNHFINNADFNSREVPTHQYRGYNKLSTFIIVNKDNVITDHIFFGLDSSTGYTPLPIIGGFLPAQPGTNFEIPTITPSFIMMHKHVASRVDPSLAGPFFTIGAHIPFVWSDITYRINSDGTYEITVLDSHFPTHNLYLSIAESQSNPVNWPLTKVLPQENLPQFMYVDPIGVECPSSSLSPSTFPGVAIAL